MRIVFISDTHLRHGFIVPDGDVLVHCGDFTMTGTRQEVQHFQEWIASQSHRHKIVIAGNHDLIFEDEPEKAPGLLGTLTYLQDSSIRVDDVTFYGSPWQPWFHDWAFNFRSGPKGRVQAQETWSKIPGETDVLITHGPPHGVLDRNLEGKHCGDGELLEAVLKVKPVIHAFGHIHRAYGTKKKGSTLFINACICDERYVARQPPVIVDLQTKRATLVE